MREIFDRNGQPMRALDLGDGRVEFISDDTGEVYVFGKRELE